MSTPAKKAKLAKSKAKEEKQWATASSAAGLGGLTVEEAARGALFHPMVRSCLDETDRLPLLSVSIFYIVCINL